MGIYLGLLLIALVIGFLAVRISQSRLAGKGSDNKGAGSPTVRRKPYRRKQKGVVGSGSDGSPTTRAIKRSALMAGTIQKPWGW
jgi:hypothetical protein